ncbi:NADH dehydrogenase [ubiquinone] 1 beta subcomplex subunit 9 [Amyelois transitella]|uniref:NADH dehydrogenase [ubiquinone] 1 beta subcomplex subunit 9 n=1 Tax=Amyelois transitella TaxID=680683 RepID=UPI00067A9828|nr:NADH dehydrogenase [ubiquinone] 1 beta subcomplex subunit 9 [Amyelois transitella]
MVFAPELRTHAQKVCSLYKKALRTLEAYYVERKVVRYHQVLLRKQFDDNRCVCDPVEQRRLLWSGEHELFLQKHPIPVAKFPKSLGIAAGVAHGRVSEPPDWVLDYWHPLEKAQYPEYFARREKRKCEYIEKWRSGIVY